VAAPPTGTRAKPPAGLCTKTPFPAEATADTALVTALVKVDAKGDVTTVSIVSDPGQGFGRVTRTCLLAAHFTPATDGSGAPVSDAVTLSVRFAR